VLGRALYEGVLLDLPLAPFFVARLQGRWPLLEELAALDPEVYRSLLHLKRYDGPLADLCLDFTGGWPTRLPVGASRAGGRGVLSRAARAVTCRCPLLSWLRGCTVAFPRFLHCPLRSPAHHLPPLSQWRATSWVRG
jgi:hypothetical protein